MGQGSDISLTYGELSEPILVMVAAGGDPDQIGGQNIPAYLMKESAALDMAAPSFRVNLLPENFITNPLDDLPVSGKSLLEAGALTRPFAQII